MIINFVKKKNVLKVPFVLQITSKKESDQLFIKFFDTFHGFVDGNPIVMQKCHFLNMTSIFYLALKGKLLGVNY